MKKKLIVQWRATTAHPSLSHPGGTMIPIRWWLNTALIKTTATVMPTMHQLDHKDHLTRQTKGRHQHHVKAQKMRCSERLTSQALLTVKWILP